MEKRAYFRPDIQGMRALAVLAVIFYHLPGEILAGGDLGVDVFFVISGYLITNQIVGKINEKTFSLFQFYKKRFWRLFPAMIFVVLITLIYASWVMSIGDLKKASHSALSATFSLSNFYFFSQEGYFDTAARVKPFLHTWSLAVEEQFYLFWPMILLGLASLKKPLRLSLVILIVALSFFTCLYFINIQPNLAFYMLPTRLFELGIGALMVFLPATLVQNFALKNGLYFVGLAGVFCSLFFFHDGLRMPGLLSLVPCFGAALVIQFCERIATARLFHFPPLVLIGDWSYTLYLVHWPVIVFYIYQNGGALDDSVSRVFVIGPTVLLLAITFAITAVCHYLVERPLRYGNLTLKFGGLAAIFSVGLSVFTASILFITLPANRIVANAPSSQEDLPAGTVSLNPLLENKKAYVSQLVRFCKNQSAPCHIEYYTKNTDLEKAYDFVVYGDSFAPHMIPAVQELGRKSNKFGIIFSGAACPSVIGNSTFLQGYHEDSAESKRCKKHTNDFFTYVEGQKDILIILSQNWFAYQFLHDRAYENKKIEINYGWLFEENKRFLEIFDVFMRRLRATGHKIVVVGDIPTFRYATFTCLQIYPKNLENCPFQVGSNSDNVMTSVMMNEYMAKKYPDFYSVDPVNIFCDNFNQCRVVENGDILYSDTSHLTVAGAKKLTPLLAPFFKEGVRLSDFTFKNLQKRKLLLKRGDILRKAPFTQQRIRDLEELNSGLIKYYKQTGNYPDTKGKWIKLNRGKVDQIQTDIFSQFMPELPKDPSNSVGPFSAHYSYISNGIDYKLLVENGWDCALLPETSKAKPDAARSRSDGRFCSAWGYWTENHALK